MTFDSRHVLGMKNLPIFAMRSGGVVLRVFAAAKPSARGRQGRKVGGFETSVGNEAVLTAHSAG